MASMLRSLPQRCSVSGSAFKETPGGVLRELRLNEANILLRDTRLPLGEVAVRSGFYSVRHLVRTFQRAYGKSPSQFRNRSKK